MGNQVSSRVSSGAGRWMVKGPKKCKVDKSEGGVAVPGLADSGVLVKIAGG